MKAYAKPQGEDFQPCPEGIHHAVCVDVIDRGLVDYEYQGKKKQRREVSFAFQVDARDEETGEPIRRTDGQMFIVYTKYTASLSDNAKLVPFLEAWLGKSIPPEVRQSGFDMDALIGRNASITVIHAKGTKDPTKTYANIKAIQGVKKADATLKPADGYVREQDREDYQPPYGSERWEELQALSNPPAKQTAGVGAGAGADDDDDDDLPF